MALHESAPSAQEVWKAQNKKAITSAVHELLSRPYAKTKKGGIEFVPLTLHHYGEPIAAKLCYEAVIKSDNYSDVDSYIHGRLSLYPSDVPVHKQTLPANGISLREDEIAALDAFIVPSRDNEQIVHARSHSATHEDWQQHGIGKTLLTQAKEAFALHLIHNDPQLAHDVKQVIFTVRDLSKGVGNVQLQNWTSQIMNEWNASRPPKDRYVQTAPEVFQKVVTLPE